MKWKIKPWKQAAHDSMLTGSIAGAATAAAAMICGKVELDNAVAPINAISHITWGDEALAQDSFSLKYTLTGLLLNDTSVGSWAMLYKLFFGEAAEEGTIALSLLGGALVSVVAYLIDYRVVPGRLTPGFEKRLSNRSLLVIYIALALGLGLGGLRRKK